MPIFKNNDDIIGCHISCRMVDVRSIWTRSAFLIEALFNQMEKGFDDDVGIYYTSWVVQSGCLEG